MEKIILLVYEVLGRGMSVVAQLPYVVELDNRLLIWGFNTFIFLLALILLLKGTAGAKGIHIPVRGGLGLLCALGIAVSAAMKESGLNLESELSVYVILAFGILMVVMLIVLAENLIIGKGQGLNTLCLWLGEWFMTSLGLRMWYLNKNRDFSVNYRKLFPLSSFDKKYEAWMDAHSFDAVITLGKWILILVLLAAGIMLMSSVKKVVVADYNLLSGSLIVAVFAYMIFLSHEGAGWDVFPNFLLYLVMAAGHLLFLFLMFYVPVNHLIHMNKEKQKAVNVILNAVGAVIKAAITGVLWSVSGILAVSLAKDGAMEAIMDPITGAMSWFYKKLPEFPYAYATNFLRPADRIVVGMSVASVLTVAVAIILFLLLKFIIGGLAYEGITISWLRNSVLIFILPVVLYWFSSMGKTNLGATYQWLPVLLRAVACLGLLLCLGNLLSSIRKKGALSLLKWTVTGLITSLLFSALLIPVLMIFA